MGAGLDEDYRRLFVGRGIWIEKGDFSPCVSRYYFSHFYWMSFKNIVEVGKRCFIAGSHYAPTKDISVTVSGK
jgi:hypothetical protein